MLTHRRIVHVRAILWQLLTQHCMNRSEKSKLLCSFHSHTLSILFWLFWLACSANIPNAYRNSIIWRGKKKQRTSNKMCTNSCWTRQKGLLNMKFSQLKHTEPDLYEESNQDTKSKSSKRKTKINTFIHRDNNILWRRQEREKTTDFHERHETHRTLKSTPSWDREKKRKHTHINREKNWSWQVV